MFAMAMPGQACSEGEQAYNDKCYPCPSNGYLKLNDGVECITCNEGYFPKDRECKLMPSKEIKSSLNERIDGYARKISDYLRMESLLPGYFVMLAGLLIVINYLYKNGRK